MKVAVIYNRAAPGESDVLNVFGRQNRESYKPEMVEAVVAALESRGHNVRAVQGNMQVIERLEGFMPRVMSGERPGMVFNMAYGIQGQSRYTHVPAFLEMLGVPYVGSGPSAHAVALDKIMSKVLFLHHGVPTPEFWVFANGNGQLDGVHYPAIVKPKMEAVSFGVRAVHDETELREAITFIATEFDQATLVEEFIAGREFAVGLLGNGPDVETLPIVEIVLGGDPNAYQSYDIKMVQHPRKLCPADVDPDTQEALVRHTRSAFEALGIYDFARVDFRMDSSGQLFVLELNSMASLNRTGSFVGAAEVAGLDFDALVNRMLEVAAVRYFGRSVLRGPSLVDLGPGEADPLRVRVRRHARQHVQTTIEHLERMVSVHSPARDSEGVNEVGTWVAGQMGKLGFRLRAFPQDEVGDILLFTNHDGDRHDILLLGHLDTLYDYQDPSPFREERGHLVGPGVAQGKGGVATILAALRALRHARSLAQVRCAVLLTSDEGLGGRHGAGIVWELASRAAWVIGTEPGEAPGGIVLSCSGVRQYEIEVTRVADRTDNGTPGGAASIARMTLAWERLNDEERGIQVSVETVVVRANSRPGRDHAAVLVTVRFASEAVGEELDGKIREIAKKKAAANGLHAQVRKIVCRPPVTATGRNQELFDRLTDLARRLEVLLEATHSETSSGICYVPEGTAVLGGFGPIGGGCGTPDEFVIRDSLIDRPALLAMTIHVAGQSGDD